MVVLLVFPTLTEFQTICLFFRFGWFTFSRFWEQMEKEPPGPGSQTVLHILRVLESSRPPFSPVVMSWCSSFRFFFLVELFWLFTSRSPSSYFQQRGAYRKDTVRGNPGDTGHLSLWESKNSGHWRCLQAALQKSAAEAGFCNSASLVVRFFTISWDLLSTSWLLFNYKLWFLRIPVVTSLSVQFLISFPHSGPRELPSLTVFPSPETGREPEPSPPFFPCQDML